MKNPYKCQIKNCNAALEAVRTPAGRQVYQCPKCLVTYCIHKHPYRNVALLYRYLPVLDEEAEDE